MSSKGLKRIAYMALIVLLFGVCIGRLGGL